MSRSPAGHYAAAASLKSASTPMTWGRSSGGADGPQGRCARSSMPWLAAGLSGSTCSTRTRSADPMRVIVGRIGRPHGIRGEVVVAVRTDEPLARFAVGAEVEAENRGVLVVASSRWHSGQLLVEFRGISNRTAAGELSGTWLSVDSDRLPPPDDPEEFRDYDLIGMRVRTVTGLPVGVVSDVLHYGQDLLVV